MLLGSAVPLAIGVMQVIALDLGSDMLPALALGAEPARADIMRGRARRSVVDRALLLRAFFLLGLTVALVAMLSFLIVLTTAGWRWAQTPAPDVLAVASGTAFAAIVFGQMATAFAWRSTVRPVWRLDLRPIGCCSALSPPRPSCSSPSSASRSSRRCSGAHGRRRRDGCWRHRRCRR